MTTLLVHSTWCQQHDNTIAGLKTLLYMQSRPDLQEAGWDGQSPPTPRHQLGKPVPKIKDIVGKVMTLCWRPGLQMEGTAQLWVLPRREA